MNACFIACYTVNTRRAQYQQDIAPSSQEVPRKHTSASTNTIHITAVHLAYNPFIQFISLAEINSQLQLSFWSDPIALGVPTST